MFMVSGGRASVLARHYRGGGHAHASAVLGAGGNRSWLRRSDGARGGG
jgi:hypothetical protein